MDKRKITSETYELRIKKVTETVITYSKHSKLFSSYEEAQLKAFQLKELTRKFFPSHIVKTEIKLIERVTFLVPEIILFNNSDRKGK